MEVTFFEQFVLYIVSRNFPAQNPSGTGELFYTEFIKFCTSSVHLRWTVSHFCEIYCTRLSKKEPIYNIWYGKAPLKKRKK